MEGTLFEAHCRHGLRADNYYCTNEQQRQNDARPGLQESGVMVHRVLAGREETTEPEATVL